MGHCVQDKPSSVSQLQAELERTRGERDALETRLKLLLQTRRAAGDSTVAAEASAAAAQLQSTRGTPGPYDLTVSTLQYRLPSCKHVKESSETPQQQAPYGMHY